MRTKNFAEKISKRQKSWPGLLSVYIPVLLGTESVCSVRSGQDIVRLKNIYSNENLLIKISKVLRACLSDLYIDEIKNQISDLKGQSLRRIETSLNRGKTSLRADNKTNILSLHITTSIESTARATLVESDSPLGQLHS